ncbi:MAG: DinB family protein [Dehalococcoidia bacterium]|nr:DinB family protein [Dehalococcoidia bacterium]
MNASDFGAKMQGLNNRLDAAYKRLAAALDSLPAEQAFKGSEWSVVDCLNHLSPREGGYSRYMESLLDQEHPAARAFSPPERRWANMKTGLAAEHQRCRAALARVTPKHFTTQVDQPDGSKRPLSTYIETMVNHFEEHGGQIMDQIIPRVRA